MTTLDWIDRYQRIPFKDDGRSYTGLNCYGLVYLVYKQELGIVLPIYSKTCPDSRDEERKDKIIRAGLSMAVDNWQEIKPVDVQCFDIVVFNRGGYDTHIALVVTPLLLLECVEPTGVRQLSTSAIMQRAGTMRYYRHKAMNT